MPQSRDPRQSPVPGRSSTLVEPREGLPDRDRGRPAPPLKLRESTLIESDDATCLPPVAPTIPAAVTRRAEPYRPTARPSVAILTVLDDGREDGEVVRLRGDRFVIGRSEGDFLVPHDARVSSRHVEIARRPGPAPNRWVVTDLRSTNGVFVRVRRAVLADGAEFLVGGGRYRFESSRVAALAPPPIAADRTLGWGLDAGSLVDRPPALVELIAAEEGSRVFLHDPETWLGTDPSCAIRRPDDPFCEPRHLRFATTPAGEWMAEHNGTHNGLWLRMDRVEVEALILFQIGEQRFRLKTT